MHGKGQLTSSWPWDAGAGPRAGLTLGATRVLCPEGGPSEHAHVGMWVRSTVSAGRATLRARSAMPRAAGLSSVGSTGPPQQCSSVFLLSTLHASPTLDMPVWPDPYPGSAPGDCRPAPGRTRLTSEVSDTNSCLGLSSELGDTHTTAGQRCLGQGSPSNLLLCPSHHEGWAESWPRPLAGK